MLFMASALANIEKKLDAIQQMRQEVMEYLVQKEKADLKGNLIFLYNLFNDYKYNWNNEMHKNSNHIKVLDIRQEAEKKVVFYREQIITKINKKSFIHGDQTVKRQLHIIQNQFKDYQLSLYLLCFLSFLEVMLLGNYNMEYLNGISRKLEDYSVKYKELYSKCYDEIDIYSATSVQSSMLKGLSKASNSVGRLVEKMPAINKGQANEALSQLAVS